MGLRTTGYVRNLDRSWVFDKGFHEGMERWVDMGLLYFPYELILGYCQAIGMVFVNVRLPLPWTLL